MMLLILIFVSGTFAAKPTKKGEVKKSYYEELGVEQTASLKEIKKAYFTLAKLHHPDKVENYDVKAQAKFELISKCYEILSESKTRERYDKLLALGEYEYKEEQFAATDRAEAAQEAKQKAERKKRKDPKKAYEEALLREEELARAERNQLLILGAMGTAVLGLIVWFVVGKFKSSAYYKKSEKEKEEKIVMQKITENQRKRQQLEQELLEKHQLEAEETAQRLEKRLEQVEREFQEIDESKITQIEQVNTQIVEDLVAAHEEEVRAKKAKVSLASFHCSVCKKTFKSVPQWDNHVESNKHKSATKSLKGDVKIQFDKSMKEIAKLRDQLLKEQKKGQVNSDEDHSEETGDD